MPHTENIEQCKSIFVSWVWMVSFIVGFIVIIGSIAWAGSAAFTTISNVQSEQTSDISELKSVYKDVDTVKDLIRQSIRQNQLRKQ